MSTAPWTPRLHDLGRLVQVMNGLLVAVVVLAVIGHVVAVVQIASVPSGVNATTLASAQTSQLVSQGVLAFLTFVALVGGGVTVTLWTSRARSNAELLSPYRHRTSAGWAAASWWVPFANLVVPPRVLRDLWRATHRGSASGVIQRINWWQAMCIALPVLAVVSLFATAGLRRAFVTVDGSAASLAGARSAIVDAMVNTLLVNIVMDLLALVPGLLLLWIVREISRALTAMAAHPAPVPAG